MKVIHKSGPSINIFKTSKILDSKIAKVGWFAGNSYPDETNPKTNKTTVGQPVAQVAVTQEYGDPVKRIPPRPFMSTTISQKKNEWTKLLLSGSKAVLAGNENPESVMTAVGSLAAGEIRKTITNIYTPELSQRTIYNRQHRRSDKKTLGNLDKPLVDTGHMLNTLTFQVEGK